ncbi:PREDICTED: uncharacterized protein LOC105148519 [Acromyrmex echinatior]|uniref:Myb/SANT-like DNA-binding domain-containing protein n=1 Tax=Acromyrmex echinatior TaxID=103372 RepID=F4WRY8_ACREC|nr:PREDICTED: uncharacterized protein LOC105148519 [Acromyrmex echinatior]EGI63034.1 hypothetical protein G5I_08594 [Acromyrmex echinatior]
MISNKLKEKAYDVTGQQCKNKIGLKKTYKNVKDYNNKSGNNKRTWPYFEMDEIFRQKPWVTPILDSSKQEYIGSSKKYPRYFVTRYITINTHLVTKNREYFLDDPILSPASPTSSNGNNSSNTYNEISSSP